MHRGDDGRHELHTVQLLSARDGLLDRQASASPPPRLCLASAAPAGDLVLLSHERVR